MDLVELHIEKKFFKKLLYFTIFYFHFASVYGILLLNSRNFFNIYHFAMVEKEDFVSKTVVVGLLFALVIGACALVFYFLGKAGAVAPWLSYLLPVLIALLYLGVALSYYIFRLEKSFHELVV